MEGCQGDLDDLFSELPSFFRESSPSDFLVPTPPPPVSPILSPIVQGARPSKPSSSCMATTSNLLLSAGDVECLKAARADITVPMINTSPLSLVTDSATPAVPAEKKRRGRPPSKKAQEVSTVTNVKRRRGRPVGSQNKKKYPQPPDPEYQASKYLACAGCITMRQIARSSSDCLTSH